MKEALVVESYTFLATIPPGSYLALHLDFSEEVTRELI